MAKLSPRNLSAIAGGRFTPQQLHECLSDIVNSANNVANQVNAEPVGITPPPQPHADLQVVGGNGKYAITMMHTAPSYRGLTHSVEYDTSQAFTNPQPVHLGPNKTAVLAIGDGPFFFRSTAQYPTSAAAPYKYLAGSVGAGGASDPPMPASQGSGYGAQPYTTDQEPKRA